MADEIINPLGKITEETLELTKTSLQKSVTTATGLVGYSLEAPAKQLIPFLSPLRNRIPRVTSKTGTAANWKAITAVSPTGKFSTKEGERGGAVKWTSKDCLAAFKSFGLQDSITFEAQAAARGFEDIRARATTNLLLNVMNEEEKLILAGNRTSLGTVTAPTVAKADTGGTIAAGTYKVKVAALTLAAANRVPLDQQLDKLTLPVFDGVSALSTAGSVTVTADGVSKITATVPVVQGAFAYAWFVGEADAEKLQIVTTLSTVTLTKLITTGTAASEVTEDTSADTDTYDGIIMQLIANGGYFKDFGAASLSKGDGGVVELDAINSYMFQNLKCGITKWWVSESVSKAITAAVIVGSGAPTLFIENSEKNNITGNYVVTKYINKSYGRQIQEIEVHPWLPNGCFVGITETVPYQNSQIQNVLEVEMGYEYMLIDYALTSKKYEFEIAGYGALKNYFPAGMAFGCNIKPGLT